MIQLLMGCCWSLKELLLLCQAVVAELTQPEEIRSGCASVVAVALVLLSGCCCAV